jgi:transcriptional regulator with XRE-family HTH domain
VDLWSQWRNEYYSHVEADFAVEQFLTAPIRDGWLTRAREALFLSTNQVSFDMGMDQSNYRRLENSEDRASLESLKRAAAAMNCELVYAIRPRQRTLFSKVIWNALLAEPVEFRDPRILFMRLRDRLGDPAFRRANGWKP